MDASRHRGRKGKIPVLEPSRLVPEFLPPQGKQAPQTGHKRKNRAAIMGSAPTRRRLEEEASGSASVAATVEKLSAKRGRALPVFRGSEGATEHHATRCVTRALARRQAENEKRMAAAAALSAAAAEDSEPQKHGLVAGSDCPLGHHVLPIPDGIEDVENRHLGEPRYVEEYVKDNFSYLRSLQFKYKLRANFLEVMQPELTARMRMILIDWLFELVNEPAYDILTDTLYTCVSYVDRCLDQFRVPPAKLQLLGCSCMLVADKYERSSKRNGHLAGETAHIPIDELVLMSDYSFTREELIQSEWRVLRALNFDLMASSSKNFLRRFQRAACVQAPEKNLCNYLSHLALQSHGFCKFTPSVCAAACLLLARIQLYRVDEGKKPDEFDAAWKPEAWSRQLVHYTGYTEEELSYVVHLLHELQVAAPHSEFRAVYDTYAGRPFLSVSTLEAIPEASLPPVGSRAIWTGGR